MGEFITSKTHRYISVRKYPSPYYVKKYKEDREKSAIAFRNSFIKHNKFFRELIEYALQIDFEYFDLEYMFHGKECAIEELHEKTGIFVADNGSNEQYCIPKDPKLDHIFDWIIENAPNYKILKKTRGSYYDPGPSTWARETWKNKLNKD